VAAAAEAEEVADARPPTRPAPRRGGGEGADPPPPRPGGGQSAGADLAVKIGWALFAAGLAVVAWQRGSLIGGVGALTAFGGTLVALLARFVRDRRLRAAGLPARPAPLEAPLGIALVAFGFVALLYPAFTTREVFRELVEEFPFGPMVAVGLIFSGIILLLDYLDRPAPAEPAFVRPEPDWRHRVKMLFVPGLNVYLFAKYLHESWVGIDEEAATEREARAAAGKGYDFRPLVVFTTGAVFLGLMEYFGHAPTLRDLVDHYDPVGRITEPETFWAIIRESPFRRLIDFVWWSGWRLLGFFLLPCLVLALMRERISAYGLQTRGFSDHAWMYFGFYVWVLATVIWVSYEDSFREYYPFYSDASRSWYDFWAWEALYAVQFFSLEFFFRGFWVKAGKTQMGSHAIYAMVVPYVMIHFGKPYMETNAAILAGVALGTLALRTRSIWAGFLIHVSIAISMDVAALMQTTGLPTQWWPDV